MSGANYLQFKKNTLIIHSRLGMVRFNESRELKLCYVPCDIVSGTSFNGAKGIVVLSFILIVSSIVSLREGDLHLGF